MNVTQLLHKLRVISNVEIVVPLLPEMLRIANQTPRYSLLQRLQRTGQRIQLWFVMVFPFLDLSFQRVENWSQRSLPLWLRQEIQEVL
jgi:hypothetical protein